MVCVLGLLKYKRVASDIHSSVEKKGDNKDTLSHDKDRSILCLLLFFGCWFLEDAL